MPLTVAFIGLPCRSKTACPAVRLTCMGPLSQHDAPPAPELHRPPTPPAPPHEPLATLPPHEASEEEEEPLLPPARPPLSRRADEGDGSRLGRAEPIADDPAPSVGSPLPTPPPPRLPLIAAASESRRALSGDAPREPPPPLPPPKPALSLRASALPGGCPPPGGARGAMTVRGEV